MLGVPTETLEVEGSITDEKGAGKSQTKNLITSYMKLSNGSAVVKCVPSKPLGELSTNDEVKKKAQICGPQPPTKLPKKSKLTLGKRLTEVDSTVKEQPSISIENNCSSIIADKIPENAAEISYEDYLRSNGLNRQFVEEVEMDTDKDECVVTEELPAQEDTDVQSKTPPSTNNTCDSPVSLDDSTENLCGNSPKGTSSPDKKTELDASDATHVQLSQSTKGSGLLPPKQKGIERFFKKVEGRVIPPKRVQGKLILTVKAEVHNVPGDDGGSGHGSGTMPKMKQKKKRKSNVAIKSTDVDLSITHLETIDIQLLENKKSPNSHDQPPKRSPRDSSDSDSNDSEDDDCFIAQSAKEQKAPETENVKCASTQSQECSSYTVANTIIQVASSSPNGKLIKQESVPKKQQMLFSFMSKKSASDKDAIHDDNQSKGKDNNFESDMQDRRESSQSHVEGNHIQNEVKDKTQDEQQMPSTDSSHDIFENSRQQDSKNNQKKISKTKKEIRKYKTTGLDAKSVSQKQVSTTPKRKYSKSPKANALFKSTLVRTPGQKKHTPLKIRLTRVHIKGSSSDEEFSSSHQKVAKAFELLRKAKCHRPKASRSRRVPKLSEKKVSCQNTKTKQQTRRSKQQPASQLRRSSRATAKSAATAISESFEKIRKIPTPVREKTKKSKGMAQEETNKKKGTSTGLSTVKVAPIFAQKKKASPVIVISDDEPGPPAIDPEVLRARRQFLLSGVPSTLRRTEASIPGKTDGSISDQSLWPTVSHVQQIDQPAVAESTVNAVDPWRLSSVRLPLKLKAIESIGGINPETHLWEKGSLVLHHPSQPKANKLEGLPTTPIDKDAMPFLIAEVSRFNPSYPVKKVFKQLQRLQMDGQTADEGQKTSDAKSRDLIGKSDDAAKDARNAGDTMKRPIKGRKRKNEEADSPSDQLTRQGKRRRASNVSEEVPEHSTRLSRRRSTRNKSDTDDQCKNNAKDAEECKQSSASGDTTAGAASQGLLWTDKYAPTCGLDIHANAGCVRRLRSWLEEWKQRTDLELRRARRHLLQQARRAGKSHQQAQSEIKKKLGSQWWSDDSDFELDTDDEDSEAEIEDNSLCNATVLTGPSGVGKTAVVYALAKELGYKVFEVNASSRRSGRQMLAQLQEATQSHQVSKKNLDSMFTGSMTTSESSKKAEEKPTKCLPTAFANFFTKGSPTARAAQKSKTKPAPKSKGEGAPKRTSQSDDSTPGTETVKKGLDLSSTSLVLFEEVDVLFEDDKGFWAAIQTFISTTKRPILLTATEDSQLTSQLVWPHELITLKTPSTLNTVSYLQLVCLAENLRTCPDDLHALVDLQSGDLRRCLHQLNFWAAAGGSTQPTMDVPVLYNQHFFTAKPLSTSDVLVVQSPAQKARRSAIRSARLETGDLQLPDSASDFELTPSPKRRRTRGRALVIGDESSRDSMISSPQRELAVFDSPKVRIGEMPVELETASLTTIPPVHEGLFKCVLGGIPLSGLLKSLQDLVTTPTSESPAFLADYAEQGVQLLYANQTCLLGMPGAPPSLPSVNSSTQPPATRRRIRCAAELFPSDDESDDNSIGGDQEIIKSSRIEGMRGKVPTASERVAMACVESMAEMYDVFSYLDAHLQPLDNTADRPGHIGGQRQGLSDSRLMAGLNDDQLRVDDGCPRKQLADLRLVTEAACGGQLAAVAQCKASLAHCLHKAKEVVPMDEQAELQKQLTLPMEGSTARLSDEFSIFTNLDARHQKTCQQVASALPSHVRLERRAVTTDYMPSVRAICRAEQLRQVANTKRRFLHYMDYIALPLTRKHSVMDTLNASFR